MPSTPGLPSTRRARVSTRLIALGGKVNVFDSFFAPLALPGSFVDPNLPAGFVPFNVQDIAGKVYVTYAPAGLAAQRAAAPGAGFISVFDENGGFQQRLISGSQLAAPWGLALAPAGFGQFGGDLLVGNFSFASSVINAFDPLTGAFEGSIPIDVGVGNSPGGLWGLMFGSGAGNGGDANTLYFLDGINGETAGLFGAVTSVPEPEISRASECGTCCVGLAQAQSRRIAGLSSSSRRRVRRGPANSDGQQSHHWINSPAFFPSC